MSLSHRISAETVFKVEGLAGHYDSEKQALDALENRAEKTLRAVFPALCQPVSPKDQRILVEWMILHRDEIVKALDF